MQKKRIDIVFIGDGLASLWTLYAFLEQDLSVDCDYHIQVFSDPKRPACSLHTTAQVCLRGTTKGHSELGDLLVDSHEYLSEQLKREVFTGVLTGSHYQVVDNPLGEKDKRYQSFPIKKHIEHLLLDSPQGCEFRVLPSFYFIPEQFLGDLKKKCQSKGQFKNVKLEFIKQSIDPHFTTADLFFLCDGGESSYSEQLKVKPLYGAYAQWQVPEAKWEGTSSLSVDGSNIFFRPNGEVLFGATSIQNEKCPQVHFAELENLAEKVSAQISLPFDLTAFTIENMKIGCRAKAPKRRPLFGPSSLFPDKNILVLNGLYKNGWTLAPYLGSKMAQSGAEILNSCKF